MNDMERDPTLQSLLRHLDDAGSLDNLDDDTLDKLAAQVKAARTRRTRSARATGPRLPQRALALDALDVIGVPGTPAMIASVVHARTGSDLDPRSLTTARRDDRVSWFRDVDAGKTPAPKLSPALHHELLEPVRALVTISSWPIRKRIVTPHSPRHDHPAAVLALLDEADRLTDVDTAAADRVGALACRLAVGIAGATAFDTSPAGRATVRRAAEEECDRFAEDTESERAASAKRAQMLQAHEQVWGLGHKKPARADDRAGGRKSRAQGGGSGR